MSVSDRPGSHLTPETFPRLALFLHESFDRADGRSPHNAVQAAYDYARDAEMDELAELYAEWRALVGIARELPIEALNKSLAESFRTSFRATSLAELEEAENLLERAVGD